jgi:hypothetical protein
MRISRETLIDEAQRVFNPPLNAMGYFLNELTFEETTEYFVLPQWEFTYEKRPAPPADTWHIIWFQPGGVSHDDLFDLKVELLRCTWQYPFMPPSGAKMLFDGELAAYFQEKLRRTLQRWHFVNVEELRAEYIDILDRLMRYGIPLMENPSFTWYDWTGMPPGGGTLP